MKKIAVLLMCLLTLTACGQPKKDSNTITLWHWMTDRHDAFKALATKYETETGIKVQVDLYAPSDAYSQRIISSAQARVLPDIFGVLDKKKVFAMFIENGFVADLTDAFAADNNAWEKALFDKALDVNRFNPGNVYDIKAGIYGVPIDVTNIQMLYNKNLLEKAGVTKVPETFDEFLAAAEALNRIGTAGLVSGWGELWMADCFASNYAFNIMGEEKIMATFRGEVPYTDPDWIAVFNVFKRMADANAFAPGIVTKPNKDAEKSFALERSAFTFNGSWGVNAYHSMNPDLEYGVMMPPPVNDDRKMYIWGGAGSSFVVNKSSANKAKAIAFLKWFTAKDQQAFLAKETNNLPSNRMALSKIPDVLSDFAKAMDNTTHPTIWKYNEHPVVSETYLKGLQSIIIGEKTPEQVAKEVQSVKEREMAKEKARQ